MTKSTEPAGVLLAVQTIIIKRNLLQSQKPSLVSSYETVSVLSQHPGDKITWIISYILPMEPVHRSSSDGQLGNLII